MAVEPVEFAMVRIAFIVLAAALPIACIVFPLPGYGGVVYLPSGRVELPRELSLDGCAAAVRAAAKAEDPMAMGTFQAMSATSRSMGNVLGVCSAPGGTRHLVLADDIQPGVRLAQEN